MNDPNRKECSYSEKPNSSDTISRRAAIAAINCLIDRFEQILRDIRESKVDDSVCGMCEYDGAYIGQSGDWCNECPGFDKEDCFKLSDECRKRWLKSVKLPSAQLETNCSEIPNNCPSAQPEQKKGKWIGYKSDNPKWLRDDGSPVFLKCSACNTIVMNNGSAYWNFCPNCGADMR